jgi:hypothetical protein
LAFKACDDVLHLQLVILSNLHVEELDLALGGHDLVRPQKVLDGDQRTVRVKHLGSHRVAQLTHHPHHWGKKQMNRLH